MQWSNFVAVQSWFNKTTNIVSTLTRTTSFELAPADAPKSINACNAMRFFFAFQVGRVRPHPNLQRCIVDTYFSRGGFARNIVLTDHAIATETAATTTEVTNMEAGRIPGQPDSQRGVSASEEHDRRVERRSCAKR